MAARRAVRGGTSPESSSEITSGQTHIRSAKPTLPKKQKALSLQLSARGQWSMWPAFAAGQTVLRNHKPCSAPEERTCSNEQALLTIPKPRHLEQLESYLRKELQTLDLTKGISQELKLQPYREIFEFFIDNFKTYKPLLSAIKNEYEATLAHQKEMIRALEPLKAMVTTVSEECTQQILALQEKEKVEINTLKQEKHHLLKFIDNMKEEKCSLQTQVEHLQMSVAEEYTRYLQEYGARKLLLAKLNDMHNEQLNVKQHQAQEKAVKGEDVVKLTLALKMARQDLTKAQVKLNAMTAEYGDVVPRRRFESLEKKYSDLLQEMKTLRKDFDQLHEEYGTLLEIHRETAEERDSFFTRLQEAERSHTPRPNWAKCSEVIPGGAERWDRLAKGKSSHQLVDVLLEEIGTGVLKEMNVFRGWGKGNKVPVHLRYEGEVKNKKPTKKDVVNILKDIWKEKTALDQQTGKRSSLPEFFLSYLQKKYGDASAVEWSYTLSEYMRLCPSNHVMSSFYEILTGKVAEEQYHSQNQLISDLQKELAAYDSYSSGSLPSEQFRMALREAFPLKRRDAIQELVDASTFSLDSDDDFIDYISLFKEDEEGNPEPFVAKLRSQYVSEKQEYLQELKNSLGDVTEVDADDLKAAFCRIDPEISDQTLDAYIGLAYQVRREQPDQEVVPVDTILERLCVGDVRRVGPSPRKESTTDFEGE
ncbi:translin-associated factor X-interacting protein 1 isoform X1 [Gallus gallus]|uniref:translin-associated factor X-interacting protein 1 isoform X1 n=2 Tax=Gallus gallus TaxID=9031 RepID=UPI001AE74AFE|nr:translin-associated factor X-interacting protein 1 isoform X1 [Gallus gallus]